MKTSILTTVFLFLELIILVIMATNGIWGMSETGERNIYLIFAVFVWVFGTIVLKKTSSRFLRPTLLTLGLLVLTSQVQVAHDLMPLKVAGALLINQLVLGLFGNKNIGRFIDVINVGLAVLVWRAFSRNNVDVQYFFIFSKDIAVKSIMPTLVALFCYFSINKIAAIRIFRKLLLMLVIVGITGVSLVVTLPYNYRHHSFFLGPLLKISSGGTMLVDTYSQYGAGLFYFLLLALKAINLGVTYTGLGFITSLFQVFSFFGLFGLCYYVFRKNLSLAILITGIAILAQFYLAIGIPTFFPSTGVFRFGLTYILAASFIVSGKYLKGWLGQIYAGLIVGVAAVWSFDILTSTLYVFGAIQLLDFLENKSLVRIIRAFVLLGVSTAVVVGLFVLFTFLRSGSMPNIIPYLAFLKLYANGFGLIPISGFGVWWLFLVMYTVSAIWSCYTLLSDSKEEVLARAVFLITAVGIGILPYYVGRSHPNNLFHVGLPFLFLTGFWIWKNRYIRVVGVVLLSFFVAYEITFNMDPIKEKFATTILGLPHGTAAEAITNAASQDRAYWYSRLPALKDLDLTKVKSVSTLLPYDRATGILSLLGKNNLATVTGDLEEDLLAWAALKSLVLKQVEKMNKGDLYIGFYDECSLLVTDKSYLWDESHLQDIYYKLASTYDYKKLESFEDISILEVIGPKTNDSRFDGFPGIGHKPILYSVSPNVFTRTGNLENKFQIEIKGDNLTPTTIVNVGFSKLKTQYKNVNELSAEIPELILNRSGSYEVSLNNCVGSSGAGSFMAL